jgi:hypothetical protein
MVLNLQQALEGASGSSGLQELELVVEKIDMVIDLIEVEQAELQPVTFAFGASIADGSFGRADSSSHLSHHYNRAHEVTWKTLRGVKEDLVAFREACRAARDAIREADDQVADQMRTITSALGIVEAGGRGQRSHNAHQAAQQNQDVTPPPEPATDSGPDTVTDEAGDA